MSDISREHELKLYYNPRLHLLGLAEDGWQQIAIVKFVPFVRNRPYVPSEDIFLSHGPGHEGIGFAELPTMMPFTAEWEMIGLL